MISLLASKSPQKRLPNALEMSGLPRIQSATRLAKAAEQRSVYVQFLNRLAE
jgi:hypothetical protein